MKRLNRLKAECHFECFEERETYREGFKPLTFLNTIFAFIVTSSVSTERRNVSRSFSLKAVFLDTIFSPRCSEKITRNDSLFQINNFKIN